MTTNEILARQNFITKVLFKNGDESISKDLKVKIMAMRIEYSKVRKQFDEDIQEFIKGVTPEGFVELQNKQDKTEEEQKKLAEMIDKINVEYNAYINKISSDECNVKNEKLTEDDFNEIVAVMPEDDIEINGQKIPIADYLEVLHALFVD